MMARAVDSQRRVGTTRHLVSGRVRDLGALRTEQRRSVQGELRMALVLGDAGSGKTRLAAELLPRDNKSTIGLVVHNSPFGAMPPLGPWADTLGRQADDLDADRVCRVCGSGLGGLPALVPRAAHDASSCAQALRYHLVEWVPTLLAKASAARPVTVIIDDAHQGHDAVWEMLLRLAWEAPGSRLFVHVTARPAELAGHRVAVDVLHALEQEALLHRLQLAPFSREDVRELAAEIFQPDCVPSTLVDWLMARAQGNPRFVLGLLEALVDNGTDLRTPAVDGVPEKLARWVRTEVTRLDQPAVALVELLTVTGDLVDSGDLARIAGQPIEDVALTLERLERCGMVVEQRHGQSLGYRLAHPLTREVLYTDMGGARRRVTHRRVAATLLESGRTEAAAPHLARAAQAGDGEATDALVELAQRAAQHRRQDLPTRGSLTSRERQVAELAAGGYTAPQIATRLHIGVRTVESHLARSYPKLGVTSKQQLVHRAAELGFTPDP